MKSLPITSIVLLLGSPLIPLTSPSEEFERETEEVIAGLDDRSAHVHMERHREGSSQPSPGGGSQQPPADHGGSPSPGSGESGGSGDAPGGGPAPAPLTPQEELSNFSFTREFFCFDDNAMSARCQQLTEQFCPTDNRATVIRNALQRNILGVDCGVPEGEAQPSPREGAPETGVPEAPPVPVITEQDFAELPIEAASVEFHPELLGFGFVNRHTNIWAESETQVISREMLGYDVEIRAIPVEYHWDYGDGTTRTTLDPGTPTAGHDAQGSPADITDVETATSHVYTETGLYPVNLQTSYVGEYRVDRGPWMAIPGSVAIGSSPGEADIWRVSTRNVSGPCKEHGVWGCNGPVELEPGQQPPEVFEDQYDQHGNWTG